MSERQSDSATNEKSIGVDSRSVTGVKAPRESEQTLTRMRGIADHDKRITGVIDSTGPGEMRKGSLDPDIINAITAAGDTINSAGDVAESLIKIGVAAKGGADIAKKGLEKIKGDKDNNAGSGDASDKE